MKKPFEPNLKTPPSEFSKAEAVKLNSLFVNREVNVQFREDDIPNVSADVEALAKSYGVYMEFDRANTGREKDWSYMIRISIPGGGRITREQWNAFDDLSEKYTISSEGKPSIRLTTRQNVQFHWVKKRNLREIIKTLAEKDMFSLNGCGDNTRNVMGCPLSKFSNVFDANGWAYKAGKYFQLPLEPYMKVFAIDPQYVRKPEESFKYGANLLNRKFKIAFSTVHRNEQTGKLVPDNCVELLTNDLAIAPVVEDNKIVAFQIYVGGGQGERNGYPGLATLAQPLGIVTEDQLMKTLDAVVAVHQEWGDRENRHWARLKYVIKKMGTEWYRDQVTARLGFPLQKPNPNLNYGDRHMHHGWWKQPSNGLWTFGAFIENGRVIDGSPNGNLKKMIREVMNKYDTELMISPNQDALFTNIPEAQKEEFEADLKKHGFGQRNGKPFSKLRMLSGACVGRDTCRLTYTDSEKFEPLLIDELEKMGWGNMAESIGITGCERQCFRPATKTIGLVGTGLNRYQFKLFGDETGRFQGKPLIESNGEKMHLRSVPREKVPVLIDVLFKDYLANKKDAEGLGAYHRRIGPDALIEFLKNNPATTDLMTKPFPTDYIIE